MNSSKAFTITLEMNMDEATWLKDLVANPICLPEGKTESDYDRLMRKHFFNALGTDL